MQISDKGVDMIKGFEGCRLDAYKDVAGLWTIGVGHRLPDRADGWAGLTWTQAQVDMQLRTDLEHFEAIVNTAVKAQIQQRQFDALVSLAFNIGAVAFAASTLVKRLNALDSLGAAAQFTVWNRTAGAFNAGLLARRTAELLCFVGA